MAESVRLPRVPEPVLTPDERTWLLALFEDPAFWEWFEAQPEPTDGDLDVMAHA